MSNALSGEPIPPRPDGLVPQPHGGAIRPRGLANGGTSWKAAKKQARADLAAMTPRALDNIWESLHSGDDRVRYMAAQEVVRHMMPDPKDIGVDDTIGGIDVSRLTKTQQKELMGALATVRRLSDIARGIVAV